MDKKIEKIEAKLSWFNVLLVILCFANLSAVLYTIPDSRDFINLL
jgi:hypothetical protein